MPSIVDRGRPGTTLFAPRTQGVQGTGMVPIATHCQTHGLGSSSTYITDGGRFCRIGHRALTEFSAIRLVYGNFQTQNAYPAEQAIPNPITVRASVEFSNGAMSSYYPTTSWTYSGSRTYAAGQIAYSGGVDWVSLQASNTGNTPADGSTWWQRINYFPVHFPGENANRDVTIQPNSIAVSEPVLIQPSVTQQQTFYSRTLVQPNNGTANTGSYPGATYGSTLAATGDWVKAAATGAAPPDYTLTSGPSSTATDGYSTTNLAYSPMAIIGYPKNGAMPVVMILGDSYMQGSNETTAYLFNYDTPAGWGSRLITDNPSSPTKVTYPHVISSKGGARALYDIGSAMVLRSRLFGGVTHLLDEKVINDVSGGATLAQLQANALARWSMAGAAGVKVIASTCPPETTSTDSWATVANQTFVTGFGPSAVQGLYNTWLKTFPHPALYAVVDAAAAVSDSGTGKWNPAYSDLSSGIHPSTAGHIQIATASNVYYATAPSTPVPISAAGLFGAPPAA